MATTVVLVHGGFVDGSGWKGVYQELRADGIPVRIVQNSTLTLHGDVDMTNTVLNDIGGPTILVGHSYGGAVITEAGNHDSVKGLVYVTAFAPDAGESVGSLIEGFPKDGPQPPILPPVDGYLTLDREKAPAAFAGGLSQEDGEFLADSQVPWGAEGPGEPITTAAWRSKPSWFLHVTDDKMIPPVAQSQMAERIGATVAESDGSHAVYVARPTAVADLIKTALHSVDA